MVMGIDKAGTDDSARTVDDIGILAGRVNLGSYAGDKSVADQDAVIP